MRREVRQVKDNAITTRLKDVIKKDKEESPSFVKDVIKSDFFYLINNFFEVDFCNIDINIEVNEKNMYNISLQAVGDRAKLLRKID